MSDKGADKAELVKKKIENQYASLAIEREEAEKRRQELEKKLKSMNISDAEKDKMRKEFTRKELASARERRKPISESDFEIITIIGRGAFGEVKLVKKKGTNDLYALKKLRKSDMSRKEQVSHAWSERHVLVAADHGNVCRLMYAFQDEDYLFLVMEYLPGGDLMTLLIDRDTLTEEETKFYAAEMAISIDAIHKLGYIHRDIKPDNLLIDAKGHLKLSDFGLCKSYAAEAATPMSNVDFGKEDKDSDMKLSNTDKIAAWKRNARKQAFSTVGTPDYIAPEVLLKRGYGKECDYWSLGCVIYECLVGYPPFYAEDAVKTCKKILNWKEALKFPPEAKLSWTAKNFILGLLCDAEYRLGAKNGIDDLKSHPFFADVDWNSLSSMTPPFVPELSSPQDTKYFEDAVASSGITESSNPVKKKTGGVYKRSGQNEFVGFTFKRTEKTGPPKRGGLDKSMFANP